MSAQTGRPTVAPPAPNSRRLDRARIGLKKLEDDPNPIWMREMRQSARLQRTPVILAITTGLMALLMCSIGGFASVYSEPAKVGVALFHTFFSLAFAVVTWIAPAVAASTIASERGGRTWEALLLTGLGAVTIARGKFMAALSYISLYIVMLAPVGVLPFLFSGVSALEVVIAFLLLFCFAVLGSLETLLGMGGTGGDVNGPGGWSPSGGGGGATGGQPLCPTVPTAGPCVR